MLDAQSEAQGLSVAVPAVVLVALLAINVIAFWLGHRTIDRWLAASKARRVAAYAATVVAAGVAALLQDWIDFSGIASGNMTQLDWHLLLLWAPAFAAATFCTVCLFYHHETSERRINDAENRLQSEVNSHKSTQRKFEAMRVDFNTVVAVGEAPIVAMEQKRLRLEEILTKIANNELTTSVSTLLSAALLPGEQVHLLLNGVHTALTTRHPRTACEADFQLRVALFEKNGDYFEITASWDGTRRQCISSPRGDHRSRFKWNGAGVSRNFAIGCSVSREPLIYGSAKDAHENGRLFEYYDEEQKSRIRSIAGFRLADNGDGSAASRVIIADSNVSDFFNAQRDATIFRLLRDLASACFLYEYDLKRLLEFIESNAPQQSTEVAQGRLLPANPAGDHNNAPH